MRMGSSLAPSALCLPALCAMAALAASPGGSSATLNDGSSLWDDDPIFGLRGDGSAEFPRFDADFPSVELGKPPPKGNCSVCGGRDGCVDCLCVKKCKTPQSNESLPFLSRTLGSHMVLQRAPASAMVYGHAKLGATVTTTFGGRKFTTTTDSVDVGGGQGLGTWRQALPPTPGGKTTYTLSFASSAGDSAVLEDVLFGEVYFCSGKPQAILQLVWNIMSTWVSSDRIACDHRPEQHGGPDADADQLHRRVRARQQLPNDQAIHGE